MGQPKEYLFAGGSLDGQRRHVPDRSLGLMRLPSGEAYREFEFGYQRKAGPIYVKIMCVDGYRPE